MHLKNISLRDSMQTQRIDKQPRHTMESAREKVPDDANMDFFATLAKLDCSTPPLECSSSAAPASGVRQDEPTEDGMPPPLLTPRTLESVMFSEKSPGPLRKLGTPCFKPYKYYQGVAFWTKVVPAKGIAVPGPTRLTEKGDEIYDGRWKNRQFDGSGTYYRDFGSEVYSGQWTRNKPHGQGEWIFRGWDDTGSGYGLAETARGGGKNGKIEPLTLGHDGRSRLGDRSQLLQVDNPTEQGEGSGENSSRIGDVLRLCMEAEGLEELAPVLDQNDFNTLDDVLNAQSIHLHRNGNDDSEDKRSESQGQDSSRTTYMEAQICCLETMLISLKDRKHIASANLRPHDDMILPMMTGYNRFKSQHLFSHAPTFPELEDIFPDDVQEQSISKLERLVTAAPPQQNKKNLPPSIDADAPITWFRGSWLMGKVHGFGVRHWSHGSFYVGWWKAGKRHGQGVEFWRVDPPQLSFSYSGDYLDDKRSGQGKLYFASGVSYRGGFKADLYDGYGKETRTDGSVYEGNWQRGKLHGKATVTHANGSRYEGHWRRGRPHGEGKWMVEDGLRSVTAHWKQGRIHGSAKIKFPAVHRLLSKREHKQLNRTAGSATSSTQASSRALTSSVDSTASQGSNDTARSSSLSSSRSTTGGRSRGKRLAHQRRQLSRLRR